MVIYKGLQDVVAGQTAICFIDGKLGRLIYRGYDIPDLSANCTFEEVAFLVWHGKLSTKNEFSQYLLEFKEYVDFPDYIQKLLVSIPRYSNNMDVLRTAVSYASHFDTTTDTSLQGLIKKSYRLTNLFNSVISNWYRIKRGEEYILPDRTLSFSQNFLYQLSNNKNVPEQYLKAFDVALILHIDHGFNASTFAARQVVSTLSDIYSGIVAAIGALKGPLHGGANEQVIKMMFEINEPENAVNYLKKAFNRKQKIYGFGHRVYKTYDPRAKILREYSIKLGENHADKRFLKIADIIEKFMIEEKNIFPNVDFYSALVYHYLGIRPELFTPIFALARIVGWTAHIIEQLGDNKIIRPLEEYVGPSELKVTPIDKR